MPKEKEFGTEKKIKEYKIMTYLGVMMIIGGALLSPIGKIIKIEAVFIYSLAAFFIGVMIFFSGILGLREETKKKGEKKISTTSGGFSMTFSIISVLISARIPVMAILLGIIAAFLGYRAIKNNDNVYGSTGIILGIVGIATGAYIGYIFDYWWPLIF
ncbi:MAG: hypothetical protein ACLFVB_09420 [Thermoplasmata archaeon]